MPDESVHVEVQLWRNVQPGADEGPVLAAVTVTVKEEEPVVVERIVLTDGGRSATVSEFQLVQLTARSYRFTTRDGPRWAVGGSIGVVVRVRAGDSTEDHDLGRLSVAEVG